VGIGFVLLIYLIVLAILVVPAVLVGGCIGYWLSRKSGSSIKRRFILGGILLPIIGAMYAVGCLIVLAAIGLATGRDVGFGDGFDVPLHNHYHWMAIDEPDSADVYDTRDVRATDGSGDVHVEPENRDAFANVLELQEEGDWLAGAFGTHNARFNQPRGAQVADRWFLFNTRTHERIDAGSEEQLRQAAAAKGFVLRLQSSERFYSSRRWSSVDGVVLLVLSAFPVLVIGWLWREARRLLRNATVSGSA
jgi:hypothetical protein